MTTTGAPVVWRVDRIVANGVELARYRCGPDDAPAALLLHGLGHWTSAAWDKIAPALGERHRIVAIDLPGFGASARPDVRYDLPFFRAVVDDVARQSLPPRYALIGHSLGGMIAADVAAHDPDRVDHLALIAPAGFADVPSFVVRVLGSGLVRRFFQQLPSRRFVEKTLRDAVIDPAHLPPAVLEQAVVYAHDPLLRRAFAGIYSGAMQEMRDLPALHRRFARYHGPVFLGWGRADRYIPLRALRNAQRTYPAAVTRVFDASSHLIMDDEPAALAAALLDFLQ